jgi:hypothetical protein
MNIMLSSKYLIFYINHFEKNCEEMVNNHNS